MTQTNQKQFNLTKLHWLMNLKESIKRQKRGKEMHEAVVKTPFNYNDYLQWTNALPGLKEILHTRDNGEEGDEPYSIVDNENMAWSDEWLEDCKCIGFLISKGIIHAIPVNDKGFNQWFLTDAGNAFMESVYKEGKS